MKKALLIIVALGITLLFGMSAGHNKHFPFTFIYYLKTGKTIDDEPKEQHQSIMMRNLNFLDYTQVDSVNITDSTGIYITYGQSNSANSGEIGYEVKQEVYQFVLGNTFIYKDPSLGATGNRGSVWGMVGDKLITKGIHDKVIFANCGWSGRKIEELKGGDFLEFLISNYDLLVKKYGRVDGILFHQGEADNGIHKTYYEDFTELIKNLSNNGITIPLYLSRASYCSPNPIDSTLINIQNKLIKEIEIIKEGPNTDELINDKYRRVDKCHFSLLGYEKFSDMWVNCIQAK